MKSYILNTKGNKFPIEPLNGTDFSLQELYDAIGDGCDCVTIHRIPGNRLMVVDDDGYSRGKETNPVASVLAHNILQGSRGIVGNVVVCQPGRIK